MAEAVQAYSITAPGFYGLNTQDSSLDLASGFALVANNCVIDQYGRIGARKGWTKVNSSVNTDLSTNDITSIGEVVTADATSYTIMAGNNKLYKLSGSTIVTLTYGGEVLPPLLLQAIGKWFPWLAHSIFSSQHMILLCLTLLCLQQRLDALVS